MQDLNSKIREMNARWKDLPRRLIITVLTLGAVFLFGKSIRFVLPFLIAAGAALLLLRPARAIESACRKIRIPARLADTALVLVVYATIGALIYFIGRQAVHEIAELSRVLPGKIEEITQKLSAALDGASLPVIGGISPDAAVEALSTAASSIASRAGDLALGALDMLFLFPRAILFLVVTVMGSVYFLADRARLRAFALRWTPEFLIQKMGQLKRTAFRGLAGQVKSACIMMVLTSLELIVGFSALRFPYGVALGLFIGVMDVFPVIGAGTFLLPMSAYFFITGDIRLGIAMLVFYAFVVAMRQIVEPRVVSYQLGLHPIEVLAAMYVGLTAVGMSGVLIGPVIYLLLKAILATEEAKPYEKKKALRRQRRGE